MAETTDRRGQLVYDGELQAIARVLEALEPLDDASQRRVLAYVLDRVSPELRGEPSTEVRY